MLVSGRTTNVLIDADAGSWHRHLRRSQAACAAGRWTRRDHLASTDSVRLPGTPISSGPFTISASGHYYLTLKHHRDRPWRCDHD